MDSYQASPFGALPRPQPPSGYPLSLSQYQHYHPYHHHHQQQQQQQAQQHQFTRPFNAAAQYDYAYESSPQAGLAQALSRSGQQSQVQAQAQVANQFRLPTPPGMYAGYPTPVTSNELHMQHQIYAQQHWQQRRQQIEADMLAAQQHAYATAHSRHAVDHAEAMNAAVEETYHRFQPQQAAIGALQPPFQQVDNTSWQAAIMAPRTHFGHVTSVDPPVRYESLPMPHQQPVHDYHPGWHAAMDFAASRTSTEQTRHAGPASQEFLPGHSDFYDNDHPSFAKPPHRQSSASRGESKRAHALKEAEADQGLTQQEEIQLIAPNASAIPPPPPIEKSAHPLAALATDIVWEAFLAAANSNGNNGHSATHQAQRFEYDACSSPLVGVQSSSPPSLRHSRARDFYTPSPRMQFASRSHSQSISPYVPKHDRTRAGSADVASAVQPANVFGAIGGERKPRSGFNAASAASPSSDISSPASSAPGTPAAGTSLPWAGLRVWEDEHQPLFYAAAGKNSHNGVSRSSPLANKFSHSQGDTGSSVPPTALFEQIQKLLGATLLSQQVLLLALYFIARLPPTSPLYPPATSSSALRSTSAPFKLFLAALVVANKHLDDNSFRNSTFSAVSNVALPEVNALEHSLLAALSFDVNVESEDWLQWLQELQYQRPTRFTQDQVLVGSIITPLIETMLVQQTREGEMREEIRLGSSPITDQSPELWQAAFSPSHPAARARKLSYGGCSSSFGNYSPRSDTSYSTSFDFDAAVPHELRPKYANTMLTDDRSAGSKFFGPDVQQNENHSVWGRPGDRMEYSYERAATAKNADYYGSLVAA